MKKDKLTKVGVGRPRKWHGRQRKMLRVPVEFAEKIIELIDYMDANQGNLPENCPKSISVSSGEFPYPRASFYTDKDDFEDDLPQNPMISSSLQQMMSPELQTTAEWRKNYLKRLMDG